MAKGTTGKNELRVLSGRLAATWKKVWNMNEDFKSYGFPGALDKYPNLVGTAVNIEEYKGLLAEMVHLGHQMEEIKKARSAR